MGHKRPLVGTCNDAEEKEKRKRKSKRDEGDVTVIVALSRTYGNDRIIQTTRKLTYFRRALTRVFINFRHVTVRPTASNAPRCPPHPYGPDVVRVEIIYVGAERAIKSSLSIVGAGRRLHGVARVHLFGNDRARCEPTGRTGRDEVSEAPR